MCDRALVYKGHVELGLDTWTGGSISNRGSSLSPSHLMSRGNTSYQLPLRSVPRNAVMSFLFTDCVAARSTESTLI